MKKVLVFVLAAVMVVGMMSFTAFADEAGDFQGNPITLKFSHNNASTTPLYEGLQQWCDAVNEATHGTVTIEQYPSESLGPTTEGINMLDTGIADLLWATTGMFSGQFNYLDTFALPGIGSTSSVNGTNAIWDVYEGEFGHYIDEEFSGMKVLQIFQSEGGIIGSNEKIEKVGDLSGKVVRSIAGGMADYMTAVGASPTFMGPADIYLNMEKKVIDAFAFEWAGVQSFTLGEQVPYFLDINIYRVPGVIMISDMAWNKLSEDQQNAILSVSLREGSLKLAELYDNVEGEYKESCVANYGTELVVPDEAAQEEFFKAAEPVWEGRQAILQDGEAFFNAVVAAVESYEK